MVETFVAPWWDPLGWSQYFAPITPFDVATGFAACFAVMGVADYFFFSHHQKSRWFAVHAFANLFVTLGALPAMWSWFQDPLGIMDVEKFPVGEIWGTPFYINNQIPGLMVPAVHIYHLVVFRSEITGSDLFHHLVFVPFIAGAGLLYKWGPGRNVLGFFISGLPGGIDYLLLALVKRGKMHFLEEKRHMRTLNTWIRVPGLIIFAYTLYITWLYDRMPGSCGPIALVAAVFVMFNGLYYGDMAVDNYAERRERFRLDSKHKAELAEMDAKHAKERDTFVGKVKQAGFNAALFTGAIGGGGGWSGNETSSPRPSDIGDAPRSFKKDK